MTVPARDRVEVRFPAAARRPGTARFQVGAAAGRYADAASFALPVWTPATTEAFATYGQIDQGAVRQPVAAPTDVVREFGGLEVTTSSTALQSLTDAVLYLVAYPFECAEQLSSRVLAVAALKDVLGAFQAQGLPSPSEMTAAVDRDLAAPAVDAERGRRLRVLAARGRVVAVRLHPRRARARARAGEGLRGAGGHARAVALGTSRPSTSTSGRTTARRPAARCSRTPCTCGSAWATATRSGRARSCARRVASRRCRWSRSAGCCRCCPATRARRRR